MTILSNQLGVNISQEIASDPQAQLEMKNILGRSMSELAETMSQIDEERTKLFEKLTNLQVEVSQAEAGTKSTDVNPSSLSKEDELEYLLRSQDMMMKEYEDSRRRLDESTRKLSSAMNQLQEVVYPSTYVSRQTNHRHDLIVFTNRAIALFPRKSLDKKAAFVVALVSRRGSFRHSSFLFLE